MNNCYIDVEPKVIKKLTAKMLTENQDSVLVLPAIIAKETYAPTKRKKYYRISFEAIIPTEAINGNNCLTDFGACMILRLPRNRISSKFSGKR